MSAKDYLSQVWRINKVVALKLEQVNELRALAEKASTTLSLTPPSGTPNPHRMEDIIVKMVDLQAEAQIDVDNLLTLKKNITAAIKAVSNPDYRTLLELRYLLYTPWNAIAKIMHYNKNYIFELHTAALSEIKVPAENESEFCTSI